VDVDGVVVFSMHVVIALSNCVLWDGNELLLLMLVYS
jgi:hypothetical protein